MIYKFHCNLCQKDDEFDVEEFDIEDCIKFSINRGKKEIHHLCEKCQNIIYTICGVNNFEKKINALMQSLHAHAVGVQNVYDLFNKLTDATFISDFDRMKKQLFDEIRQVRKEVQECNEFMQKGYKKMSVINELYSLRNSNSKLITKIAEINKLMKDFDEDEY